MDKTLLAGVFAILAIVGIVFIVNSSITGMYVDTYGPDFYVRPSGMQMRVESGVAVLQSDVVVNQVCRNAVFCEGQARYVCCEHNAQSCQLPTAEQEAANVCPLTHRSRCLCREAYIADLFEQYG